ncbi:ribosomal protein S9/S16-domain-containing protein [Chiua virens]|nr:ribosomal protein S9/S16-domain-containing protein [Chiua virens]
MTTRLTARLVLNAIHARSFSSTLPFRALQPPPFVPPSSVTDELNPDIFNHARQRPPTPTFYTTRSDYYDALAGLHDALNAARSTLKALHLHPLPKFALDALPPAHPAWADRADMGTELGVTLSAGMYRQLVLALKELELYHRIAKTAGIPELEASLGDVIGSFESTKQVQAREKRLLKQAMVGKRAELDAYGRSYTVGRRKMSTARVWMIKVHDAVEPVSTSEAGANENDAASTSVSALLAPTVKVPSPSTTSILINSAPIAEYFSLPADREALLRPLKLTGLLGAYNVFALVRGGGTSGQSGALALAIARACASHVPEVESILRKGVSCLQCGRDAMSSRDMLANLMKRDPRMVERKKTGLAKARKAYAWVKR